MIILISLILKELDFQIGNLKLLDILKRKKIKKTKEIEEEEEKKDKKENENNNKEIEIEDEILIDDDLGNVLDYEKEMK